MAETEKWIPETPIEKRAVLDQLERLLAHPLFKNSKRSCSLLRYIIECTLQGDSSQIKERTLGVEVFGRDLEYDTNQDHIVRATAIEVRKRIAQYYHSPGHETEIRIDLPPGSYVPEFSRTARTQGTSDSSLALNTPQASTVVLGTRVSKRLRTLMPGIIVALCLVILACILAANHFLRRSSSVSPSNLQAAQPARTIDLFWGPFITSSNTVLLCVGGVQLNDGSSYSADEGVLFGDVTAVTTLSGFLGQKNLTVRIRTAHNTTYDDQRQYPTALIGRYGNPWTQNLNDALRFRIQSSVDNKTHWIEDRKNPAEQRWPKKDGSNSSDDYSIIVRMMDATTGRPGILAAGLTDRGTAAAASCLVDSKCINSLTFYAPKDWVNKSIEAVVSTQIISGHPGASRIIAVEAW